MFLSLSTTMPFATDLGFVLHKHPGKAQSVDVAVGTAHVVWPEATPERATVALLLEVDPIALVRGGKGGKSGKDGKGGKGQDGFALAQYVNDRPYAASSMLAVALAKVFRTAMAGRCDARPDLVAAAVPLEIHCPSLPARGGADLVKRLFAPLGWSVTISAVPLDPELEGWGDSPYVDLHLTGTLTVADALTQLYVLLPVLDDGKHYWVGDDEIDKLLRAGGAWLAAHPERETITRRYLRHQRSLVDTAVGRLTALDDAPVEIGQEITPVDDEKPPPLVRLRSAAVVSALRTEGASSVLDLGCGEGALLRELVPDPAFSRVVGVDVSHRALELAARRLHLDRMPDSQRARLELIQSSVTYRDDRLAGFDAVVLMEVIEHVDPPRLPALERTVFGHARPVSVLVTTPNAEYNALYPALAAGAMRHRDHRFEWSRSEFAAWAVPVASAYGYSVRYEPIGEVDPVLGPPTQMAVFRRAS